MACSDEEINCFESFKSQVDKLAKYLSTLEGAELQKSCSLLENVLQPHIQNIIGAHKPRFLDYNLQDLSDTEKQLEISSPHLPNFDSEQKFTDKFLSSVPDDSLLSDNLLIHSSILEDKTVPTCKGNDLDGNLPLASNKFSQALSMVSEDSLKYSTQYDTALKGHSSPSYLDLSHKSNSNFSMHMPQSKILCHRSTPEDKEMENNSKLIINLCSKNKSLSLKDDKNLKSESGVSEDIDNLSYNMNKSNLLLGDRLSLLEKHDLNGCSSDSNAFCSEKLSPKVDFNKILASTFSGSTSVIHSTSSVKKDKKIFPNNTDSQSYISSTEEFYSGNNENSKVLLKSCSTLPEISASSIPMDNTETEIKINCNTDTILNLKKEPEADHKENFSSNNNSCKESPSIYSIFNSLNKTTKGKLKNCKKTKNNSVKALNLMNRKCKTPNSVQEEISGNNNDSSSVASNEAHCSPVCCLKCQKEIVDISLWIEHKKTCDMNMFCTHCDIHFKSKVSYYKHMASHKRNTCTLCPSTYSRLQLLRAHMKSAHNINLVSKMFPCLHCPRVFMKRSSIYYHLQSHALPHQKVCPKCGKFLEGEAQYKEHLDDHIKKAPLQCHICKEIFLRFQQYNNHMEGHRKYICSYCETSISFSSKKSLSKHYKTAHPHLPQKVVLNKKYSCDECSRVFTRPCLLKDHKLTHTDRKPLECRLCHTKYAQRSGLMKHLKKVHSPGASADGKNKSRHLCQQCGCVYPSLALLNKHSVNVHHMVITHSCSYCDYKTKHKHLLKKHLNTHVEKKKYLCDICGSLFHSSVTLKHHTIFIHSNERSYKCNQCEKTFKNKSCLSRHNRTHSNERPYKCECGSGYKQLSHLSRHLSSAHNKKLSSRRVKEISVSPEDSSRQKTDLCYEQSNASASNVERPSGDLFLTPGNAVIMTAAEGAGDPLDPAAPLFTVLDSQLIHLVPSNLQLHQEGLHSVSLVNGELHALSLASPAYQITPADSFPANPSGEALVIHSSDEHAADGSLKEMQSSSAELSNESQMSAMVATDGLKCEGSVMTLTTSDDLSFASLLHF